MLQIKSLYLHKFHSVVYCPAEKNVNINENKQVAFRLIYPQSLEGIVPLDKPLGL